MRRKLSELNQAENARLTDITVEHIQLAKDFACDLHMSDERRERIKQRIEELRVERYALIGE